MPINDFRKKRQLKRTLYSTGVVAILGMVVFFLGHATWDVYQKAKITGEKRQEAFDELSRLQKQEATLQDQLKRLQTERGMEEEVRTKFNVAKEGEKVVTIVSPQNGGGSGAPQAAPWWKRIFGIQ
ncbi:MAG: septum formation initiator family protein [Candidatus Lloydbacteria bacterium]|nr:septum formation initiator family protein [Candidatus Lloydbacteria bacterium]